MPMKRKFAAIVCALTGLMLLPVSASAMRCGSALINKGDSQAKVLARCGEPATRSSRHALRSGTYARVTGIRIDGATGDESLTATRSESGRHYVYGSSEVLIEAWVYNFGPNQLMRQVTFANGIVEDVKTLGYGYHPDD